MRLVAYPNDNYIFDGWVPGPNQAITGFINEVTMNGPVVAHPRFVYGRRIHIETDPPGMMAMADRTLMPTPGFVDWGVNTTHTLSGVSPQQDRWGVWWKFVSWSDGGDFACVRRGQR